MVVDVEPLDDGTAIVLLDVIDERDGHDVVEYRLSYTLLEPFAPVAAEGDGAPMVAALTLGPVLHREVIQSYRANVRWGLAAPHDLECFVVRGGGAADECVMVGDEVPTEFRAEGPLAAAEHLELVVLHDPALGAVPEREPDEAVDEPAPAPAPEEEAGDEERSLDAPAWTGFAAGGGLAVMGIAALVLARRAQP